MKTDYCLITGATGFIGSCIAERMAGVPGITVIAIVRKLNEYKNVETLRSMGVVLVEGDFCSVEIIAQVFRDFTISYIIHCAAIRGGGQGKQSDYWRVNVSGTEKLLQASLERKVRKFIYCSTVGVMGTIPLQLPASADTLCNPDGDYHISKYEAELCVLDYRSRGLDAVIVRPTITYGRGSSGFPEMLVSLIKKRKLPLSGKDVLIHLLDVNALAGLVVSICHSNKTVKPIVIAADREPVSLRRLSNIIHFALYGRKYPSWIIMPGFIFAFLSGIFRIFKNDKWFTRIELISRDWYYDISETVRIYNYNASSTEEVFIKEMGVACDKNSESDVY